MMFNARKTLGLAVTEQGISAAEVVWSGPRRTVLHTAVVPFSADARLDEPERLGRELRKTLRQNGITSSRCVVGLAASWTAAREESLPAADAESLRGALSIAAEREFASGAQDLSVDYLDWSSGKGTSALLVAAPRRVVEQLQAMAKAAGLTLTAITSSAVALALATRGAVSSAGRLVLCLLPGGVELAVQSPGGVRLIRHLPVRFDRPAAQTGDLTGELRRILALAPAETGAGAVRELLLWNPAGLDAASLDSLCAQLGLSARRCALETDLSVAGGATLGMDRFAQAVALACSMGEPAAIDFLHSRLAPPVKTWRTRRTLWAVAACLALLVLGVYLFVDWRITQHDVAALQKQLDEMKDSTDQADAMVDTVTFARDWYDRRPEFLDCLREITQAFPQEGRVWATSLMIRADMQALLTGKSVNEAAALEVLDRLKSNPHLANVKPLFIRQVGGTSRDVSFAISLSMRGTR